MYKKIIPLWSSCVFFLPTRPAPGPNTQWPSRLCSISMPRIRTISVTCGRLFVSACFRSRSTEPWSTISRLTQTLSRLYSRKAAETSSETLTETRTRRQMNWNKTVIFLQKRLVLAQISSVLSFREGTYLDSNLPGSWGFLPKSSLCPSHDI